MKEKFVDLNLSDKSLQTIKIVNAILNEYRAEGYTLTLRQLYYQLVARGIIENFIRSYKRIGDVVNNGPLSGLIDWDMIEDRGRETVQPPHWESPAEIVEAASRQFAIDKWADQDNHIEVMVEKQALEGVLIPVCRTLDLRFAANKGYSSSSALYETGKRLAQAVAKGKDVWILYLGDHDPSGIDMTRDVDDRLAMCAGVPVQVKRLALNMSQIDELQPPENPAKTTDARFASYVTEFGESSWELDAVEPRRLAAIVTEAVTDLRDEALWDAAVERETAMRAELSTFVKRYRANGTNDAKVVQP